MQTEIDGKFLLNVYALVEKHGEAAVTPYGNGFTLNGLTVAPGFDGYDVYLFSNKVQLTLGFHNKWHADAKNEQEMDEFVGLMGAIRHQYG